MTLKAIINDLTKLLEQPLPGWHVQKSLMPEGRAELSLPELDDLHPAAVLIALFPYDNQWHFPLIKRSSDGFAHSGQVAFPGGRKEGTESAIETALREAEEEVNLPADQITIMGKTSALPIPVSRYLVQPVVGYMNSFPDFMPDPREVAEIFHVSLQELVAAEVQYETRTFNNAEWEIPYFDIQGHMVWGATAMMLNEFRELVVKVVN